MERHPAPKWLVRVSRDMTKDLLWVSSSVLLVALLWGIQGWLAAQPGPSPSMPTKVEAPPKDAQAQYDTLKERMETLKAKLDAAADKHQSAERLLALVLTFTSLYALALGLSSYFSLQRILSTSKEELETLRTQLEDKYPELAGLHENLLVIIRQTKDVIPIAKDWTIAYKDYSDREKQLFFLAETTVSGMELLGLEKSTHSRSQVFDFYHSLGKFYGGKFAFEGKIENRGDWERGCLYFEKAETLAVKHSDLESARKATMAKDFGVLFSLVEQVASKDWKKCNQAEIMRLRSKAEAEFRLSLSWNPKEGGSLFGLSWILSDNGEHQAAIKKVTEVIELKRWDEAERKKLLPFAFYNRAAFRVRGAKGDVAQHGEALLDLRKSAELARQFGLRENWQKLFYEDLEADGDLYPLWNTHGAEILELKIRMA